MSLVQCKCGWWGTEREATSVIDANSSECWGERVIERLEILTCPECDSEDLKECGLCIICENAPAESGVDYCAHCLGEEEHKDSDLIRTLHGALTNIATRKVS